MRKFGRLHCTWDPSLNAFALGKVVEMVGFTVIVNYRNYAERVPGNLI